MLRTNIFDDERSSNKLKKAENGNSTWDVSGGRDNCTDRSFLFHWQLETYLLVLYCLTSIYLPHLDNKIFQRNALLSNPTAFYWGDPVAAALHSSFKWQIERILWEWHTVVTKSMEAKRALKGRTRQQHANLLRSSTLQIS